MEIEGSFNVDWDVIREIGEGGQGKVFEVRRKIPDRGEKVKKLGETILETAASIWRAERGERGEVFLNALEPFLNDIRNTERGALKVLHSSDTARDPDAAQERASREIAILSQDIHPNLLRAIDCSTDDLWYVSPYYSRGTLEQRIEQYAGKLIVSLTAIRPIVEAVSELHATGTVHRDIKPENIFISNDGELILGDFGLVYSDAYQDRRISKTHMNVGSRDWMPGWAMGKRVESLTPAFDVFCLGKVLWSMLSGQPILPLWYFDRQDNNVEEMHAGGYNLQAANALFAKCIVEHESDCIADASILLREINALLERLDRGADFFDCRKRICCVCGIGEYEERLDDNHSARLSLGIPSQHSAKVKLFTCDKCGHVQLFNVPPQDAADNDANGDDKP